MHKLWEAFLEGGWGMWPILFWSIVEIGIIVERALYLFGSSSINKDQFLATMQKCILAGDISKAVKVCSAQNAPLARIVQALCDGPLLQRGVILELVIANGCHPPQDVFLI